MKQLIYIYKNLFMLISITIFTFGNASAATMHDNAFNLYYGTGITSLSIEYHGKGVSLGQPSGDHLSTNVQKDPKFDMDRLEGVFQAGRKQTEAVANAFINAANAKKDGKCHSILQLNMVSGGYVCPGALNFFIATTLSVNGSPVVNPVLFAQGNNGVRNNWWIGSKDAIKEQNTGIHNEYFYLEVKTQNGDTYRISQFDGVPGKPANSVNSFIIYKVLP